MRTFVVLGIVGVIGVTAFVTRELSQKPQPVALPATLYSTGCCPMMMAGNQAGPKNMTGMMEMCQEMMAKMDSGSGRGN